jgi:carboxyl-terminal processing protease
MKKSNPLLIIILVLAFVSCSFTSQSFNDPNKDKVLLQLITYVLSEGHFSPKDLNDDFSKQVFDEYIKRLDPFKRYFYQSDIKEFKKYETAIDDQLKAFDLTFFNETHAKLLERIDESKQLYKAILSEPFNYERDETYNADFDVLDFPRNKKAMKDRWRTQLKFSTISSYYDLVQTDSLKTILEIEKETRESTMKTLDDSYGYIDDRTRNDWFSVYINSIVEGFDPHTFYFAPEDKERFDVQMSGSFEGIGARLVKRTEGIIITELISGGPAWRQGKLESGDQIVKVRQSDEEESVNVVGMRLEDAIKLIKGPKDTDVILTVKKKLDGSFQDVSITRGIVEIEETFAKSTKVEYDGNTYGLINLPKFYIEFKDAKQRNAASDIKLEIERLKTENIQGLVLDLRNNGGGSLQTVVDIAGLFIKTGPVVQVKSSNRKTEVLSDRDRSILWDGPLVILVNELSASASEILAAAMQDYKRGIVIGSKQTYGKGTVQNVIDLNRMVKNSSGGDVGALKYTHSKFYRINGGSTQLEGVKSDVVVPDRYSYVDVGEKDQINPLPWDKIDPVSYDLWYSNTFDKAIAMSKLRMEKNAQLKLIDDNAKWLKKIRDDNMYHLNFEAYKKDIETREQEAQQFEAISDYQTALSFKSLPYELSQFQKDTILKEKRDRWHTNLSKDVYVEEALNVLKDLGGISSTQSNLSVIQEK